MRSADLAVIKVIAFYMKFPGFWPLESVHAKWWMNFMVIYAIGITLFSFYVSATIVYHSVDDFQSLVSATMNSAIVVMGLYKLLLFTYKRPMFLDFIVFVNKHLWYRSHDQNNDEIMRKCLKDCAIYVIFIVIICHMTLSFYFIQPVLDNRGKNESDRELPFKWYTTLPVEMSPWYEMSFTVQLISVFYVCVCYFCFDVFLYGVNLTLVGEFIILQENLKGICHFDESPDSTSQYRGCIYSQFIKCINQHRLLIYCADNLKELYKNCVASFVVVLSILICLAMYQLMTIRGKLLSQIHACIYVTNILSELYFFTATCDDLSQASSGVAQAAYTVPWNSIKSHVLRRRLVNGLRLVIMRSQKPSQMTVGDFSPVTLQTFTSICNLSFSFLALLRQS
ncbi:odorant receptor 49b-like [Diachasma alloeum]|uniref:Odorant receptor n=1 Tax=Diachasma alloeum TaxID=454923 RepID=A0A4E0RJC7_9HYME|nr:odorant receptor 49b-like [Diachasma alloeum]THK32852.1 odorant receptor 73 [Diachasma alloeum]